MAIERDKCEWARASSIIATLMNAHRGPNDPPVSADQVSPYTADKSSSNSNQRIKLDARNLHLLKGVIERR